MQYIISIIPLAAYIIAMLVMDSYSLTRQRVFFTAVFSGILVAVICYFMGSFIRYTMGYDNNNTDHFFPIIEELFKSLPLLFLLHKHKIASFFDAFLYGAAVGCAFALVENIVYIQCFDFDYPLLVFRSFSTSLMHAGCTAIFSLFMYETLNLHIHHSNWRFLALFLCIIPMAIHIIYNTSPLIPNIKFPLLILIFSFLFFLSWKLTDNKIRKWMFEKGDSQIALWVALQNGTFQDTHWGEYFKVSTADYSQDVREEMMKYIRLCLLLSVKAKGKAMAKSAGLDLNLSAQNLSEIKTQLDELKRMERKFDFMIMNILRHIARLSRTDRWSLQQ